MTLAGLRVSCALAAVTFISVSITKVDADAVSWNYDRGAFGGPDDWFKTFPKCGGTMQSPINISSNASYNPYLEYFDFREYKLTKGVTLTLTNKGGHTAEVIYSGTPIILRGGSLPDDYKLLQYHFHWGSQDSRGSEHILDGEQFPMELHVVHYQAHLPNVSVAQIQPNGLAVVGFFFRTSPQNNTRFGKLLSHFDLIKTVATNQDNETVIETFPLTDLLPDGLDKLHYYRYQGSLTTPPCYETVIWSIATETIPISDYQLNIFRSLYNDENKPLVNDYRPVQPLNNRVVVTNKKKRCNARVRNDQHKSS
ncbi:carbonic anhydrase-like isoform X1 [Biomphalaria glabrata]|uniref:Carbonic anhydrase n=1 Tax=Biomphalaria glabrata TaxID=6526 RepID=A0A9W2YG01_BIOGL|nr:carbonic anhydrase-like isoform X1 [Biomphalaria glabrata]XP_055861625.1 carbonic anhydrase-like isoform X1 [Biomphalaria glabrata]